MSFTNRVTWLEYFSDLSTQLTSKSKQILDSDLEKWGSENSPT